MKGTTPTILRDFIFGGVFSLVRNNLKESAREKYSKSKYLGFINFSIDLLASTLATILSSPWNYSRNIKYSWKSHQNPPSTYHLLRTLIERAVA